MPGITKQPKKDWNFTEFGQRKGRTECHVASYQQALKYNRTGSRSHKSLQGEKAMNRATNDLP